MNESVMLNVAVIAHESDSGAIAYHAQPVRAQTMHEANKECFLHGAFVPSEERVQWFGNGRPDGFHESSEKTIALCRLEIADEPLSPYATTYRALECLNHITEDPMISDLLMLFFTGGFEEGMSYARDKLRLAVEPSGV